MVRKWGCQDMLMRRRPQDHRKLSACLSQIRLPSCSTYIVLYQCPRFSCLLYGNVEARSRELSFLR